MEEDESPEEQIDAVDELMDVTGGQGGLFSQYAFASADEPPRKPEERAVVSEQASVRKRKRGAVQREDNKENKPQKTTRRSSRTTNTRKQRTVADDDDEWMQDEWQAESKEQPEHTEPLEGKEEMDEDQPVLFLSSKPPAIDFPAHFPSDPQAHAANIRRFEDRDALSEATEVDSSNDALPLPSSAAHTATSSTSIDLTTDAPFISTSSKGKVKYTPLELQVLDSKRKHPDLLLLFEVGYKYRFFGRDAEVAAKHLSIIAHPSHNFLTASIPTFRLLVHVRTLVEAGWKVGVVRQVESAAQKKLEHSGGTFSRKLCEVYSQATFLDEVVHQSEASAAAPSETASRYIMVLYEEPGISNYTPASSSAPFFDAPQVVVHVLAFDPITGSVVYDSFDDTFMRNQLDTRLRQLEPVELLLSDSGKLLSKNSWNVVNAWRDEQDVVRVERLNATKYPFDYARATAVITDYYTSASSSSASASASLDFALSLPKGPLVCLSVLIPYLQAFHLNSAFLLSSNFRPFSDNSYMLLNNSALYNLDILACSSPVTSITSQSAAAARKGSVLWLLDHTKTSFGSRLMRQWVTHPLLSATAINQRLDAVTELMDTSNEWVGGLATLLAGLPDLERGLSRIHYSTAKPKEFLLLLQAYQSIVDTLPPPSAVSSARLSHLLSSVDREEVSEVLSFFLTNLDASALDADDKLARSRYYTDPTLFPSLVARKQSIAQHQQQMRTLLLDVRRLLGPAYSSLEYKSVLTNQYLIEVNPSDVRRLPNDWQKVNSTKAKVRYHTPAVKDAWVALTRAEELLEEESDKCWQLFLQRFASHYALFRGLINVLSELDCLLSFATVSVSAGYVRPVLVEDERVLDVVGLRHPMSELSVPSYVPNDCGMSETGERLMLITGPNMGGKSSYIRSVALLVLMAQVGVYVPASSAKLSVFDSIHTRMGARDSLHTGHSTFLMELAETQHMIQHATQRSLLIFDELGRGTSTHDGVAIAFACMEWIITRVRAFTMLVTHYHVLAQLADTYKGAVNVYHMSYLSDSSRRTAAITQATGKEERKDGAAVGAVDDDVDVVFMYSLVAGVAPRSFGLNVARLAHVKEEVVQHAAAIAHRRRSRKALSEGSTWQLDAVAQELDGLLLSV